MAGQAARVAGGWTLWVAGIIALCNLVDALFSLTFLQLGLATEANPLMRLLHQLSPWAFALGKVAVVQAALFLLVRARRSSLARAGLAMSLAVYVLVVAYELAFVTGGIGRG